VNTTTLLSSSDMVNVVPRAANVFIEATSTSLGVTLNH
jgi:hypothetical protein